MKIRAIALTALSLFCAIHAQTVPSDLSQAIAELAPDTSGSSKQANTDECDITKNPYQLPCEIMPLWDSLNFKQKAAQMVMVYMSPAEFIMKHEFGGILVMRSHLSNLTRFKANLGLVNKMSKIQPLVAVDQEGGSVNRMAGIDPKWSKTPSAKAMRKMSSDSILHLATEIAAVMKSAGLNLNLAPVLDPAFDSRGKKSFMEVSDRSWGDDTTNAGKVRAFVQGMKANDVVCVSKHFPGYDSWTNSDSQIAFSTTPKERIKKNVELFRVLAPDIPVTMMSSVRFIRMSTRPAVFEPKIVNMAREMSPDMVILTDDLWGTSLRAWISGTERVKSQNYPAKDFKKLVRTALEAGNDMFMTTYPQKAVEMIQNLSVLGLTNKKHKKRIEESCARILKLKYKMGLLKI